MSDSLSGSSQVIRSAHEHPPVKLASGSHRSTGCWARRRHSRYFRDAKLPQLPVHAPSSPWYLFSLFLLVAFNSPSPVWAESPGGYSYPLIDAELTQWVVMNGQVEVLSEPAGSSEASQESPDKESPDKETPDKESPDKESPDDALRLRFVDGQGFLRTAHQYQDFELELEWRPLGDSSWESGIFFRSELPTGDSLWPSRYQIRLKEGEAGGLVGADDLELPGDLKANDWNHFRLRVVGNRAELSVNGQAAWTTEQIEPRDGFIGLQVNVPDGGRFEFRHMRITELGFRSLFNGQDLTGWEGATQPASSCWKVEDEWLICTGERGTWLRSKEQFGDFNLRFEYRLLAGGNSGIYVRVPEDGNHHGDGAGVEIQLLDDHAERYRDLKPYQYCGSVYAIVPADPRVSRPAGKWNCMEIECRGTSYRVVHNGIEIINANDEDYPELAGRLVQGYLGLQNHNEEVWFRHLRIGPPR